MQSHHISFEDETYKTQRYQDRLGPGHPDHWHVAVEEWLDDDDLQRGAGCRTILVFRADVQEPGSDSAAAATAARDPPPPPSDLVAFVHQALYGAEQGAVASHRHQDLLHGVDVALAHLSIDLRESTDQGRVTLHSPTGRRQRAN